MNREEKIALLEELQRGDRSIEDLLPPTVYFFIERSNEPGVYRCDNNGKAYSPFELEQFKKQLRPCDSVWHELRSY